MRFPLWLLVGIGGFAGSVARFFVGHLLPRTPVPFGVLGVNVAGSFVAGLLLFSGLRGVQASEGALALVSIGFLGGFTTMSAFAYDSAVMGWARDWPWLAANVALNVGGSVAAVFAGRALGNALWTSAV